ncbi:MAG: Jag N-terminal domain-containing protein, partial [Chloroflexi bacterium]|nr:Jag N-terminal domain-containing protein [Chloroflexota bacterium]
MEKRLAKQSAEFTAKTLEEALKQASQELGLSVEALEYEVVRDTTRTILGLVRRGEVTVRVMWEAASAELPSPSTEHALSALAMEGEEEREEIPTFAKGAVPQNPPELEETAI